MRIIPKTRQRRRRLMLTLFLVFGVGMTVLFLLFANRELVSLYYTPTQIVTGKAPIQRTFRVGGMVVKDSIKRQEDGVTVQFVVTDYANSTKVQYKGILPDMFTENQAAIAEGTLDKNGMFVAKEVLAKHDEKYLPPEVEKTLKKKGMLGGKYPDSKVNVDIKSESVKAGK